MFYSSKARFLGSASLAVAAVIGLSCTTSYRPAKMASSHSLEVAGMIPLWRAGIAAHE